MPQRLPTKQQEAFCLAYIELGDGAEAYSRAYNTKATHKTRKEKASRLLATPAVRARIEELRAVAAERCLDTTESMARQLDEDRKFARENGKASAAVSATVAKAKLLGLMVDKKDITIGMRPDEARQVVTALLGKFADKLK